MWIQRKAAIYQLFISHHPLVISMDAMQGTLSSSFFCLSFLDLLKLLVSLLLLTTGLSSGLFPSNLDLPLYSRTKVLIIKEQLKLKQCAVLSSKMSLKKPNQNKQKTKRKLACSVAHDRLIVLQVLMLEFP